MGDGLPVVRAAGGVVWRRSADGAIEVVVVHRPRYDDWSLPKGKQERGERRRDTALREVEEETGLRCVRGPKLGRPVEYVVTMDGGRSYLKRVTWWAMSVAEDLGFTPNDEVDLVRWVPLGSLVDVLTHEVEHELVHLLAISGELGDPMDPGVTRGSR
jgi:8-oxo-dGTP diphosphatase